MNAAELVGVLPGEVPEYAFAIAEERQGQWSLSSFGQCSLETSAPGLGVATMILNPGIQPDPVSQELSVWIMERNCANGRAPVDREIVPIVVESESAVEISVFVAPVRGGATCPGNPWHPIVVELDSPLGDRTVFDGSAVPSIKRTWPPAVESDG